MKEPSARSRNFTRRSVLAGVVAGALLGVRATRTSRSQGAAPTSTTTPTSPPSSGPGQEPVIVPGSHPATSEPGQTVTTLPGSAPSTTVELQPVVAAREVRSLGESVEGREITAERYGDGDTPVLLVGVIHGDETAGLAVLDLLRAAELPDEITMWIVESMNPDGVAADTRQNSRGVDLNRNFPLNWQPVGEHGDWQWSGSTPASEPEVLSMMAFITEVKPRLVLWYHQNYYRIPPGYGRDGEIRARYAELSGLPLLTISGGSYSGVATGWTRQEVTPVSTFVVELGDALSDASARDHADAVLTILNEFFSDQSG